jgi:glycosyltransferase involved in cell wall biosynthesis
VPYTLNFIEAWMSGIPLVVLDAGARRHRFFEIAHLIRHGVDGFVCSDPETTREAIATLQADPALGERIGQAGRASAIALFGDSVIKAEWQALLAGAACGTA